MVKIQYLSRTQDLYRTVIFLKALYFSTLYQYKILPAHRPAKLLMCTDNIFGDCISHCSKMLRH